MSSPATAPEVPKKEFSWKRLFIKAAGFGAGFRLAVCFVLGGFLWYSARPKPQKPWNEKTITATFAELTVGVVQEELRVQFTYALHNSLDRDYLLPSIPSGELMTKSENSSDLTPAKSAAWDTVTIPAKQTVRVTFTISFPLPEYNTNAMTLESIDKLSEFMGKRMKEVNSLEFYDYVGRYRILMPSPDAKPKPEKKK